MNLFGSRTHVNPQVLHDIRLTVLEFLVGPHHAVLALIVAMKLTILNTVITILVANQLLLEMSLVFTLEIDRPNPAPLGVTC